MINKKDDRLYQLDVLKSFAAIIIFFLHYDLRLLRGNGFPISNMPLVMYKWGGIGLNYSL